MTTEHYVVVEVLNGKDLLVGGVVLPQDVVQRSDLLQQLRRSGTASANIPVKEDIFRDWCSFAFMRLPETELLAVLEVCSPAVAWHVQLLPLY